MSDNRTQYEAMANLKFPKLVAEGENPKGFIAQTVNGTAKDKGGGWNRQWNYETPQVDRTGLWGEGDINIDGRLMPGSQGNRTGE